MIAHVIGRRKSFGRVLSYLAGPGRNREHENPRIIAGDREAGAFVGAELDSATTRLAAEHLDSARRAFRSQVKEPVYHVALSFKGAPEGLTDDVRRQLAEAWVERMGCFDRSQWLAVHHGLTAAEDPAKRNDHTHVIVSMVKDDDGKAVRLGLDHGRAVTVAHSVAADFGLEPVPSQEAGLEGMPGLSRAEMERERGPVHGRHDVELRVRAAAIEAGCEARFPAKLKEHGLALYPRYAKGSSTHVEGYSYGTPGGPRFSGSKLANDLSLPRLRKMWREPSAAQEVAGAFASMSRAQERQPGGPLWHISREMSRSAQTRNGAYVAASALRLGTLLSEPEKGPAEWLVIGATAINAAQQLHAAHVSAGHHAFAGELGRVRHHWQHAKADLQIAAAVEPGRGRGLGRARSTDRGIEID